MLPLSEPHLALVFTTSAFCLTGFLGLAGAVRLWSGLRGRPLHATTALAGAGALAMLSLLALGIDTGPFAILGLALGSVAAATWLLGAALSRVRPAWVDLLVILSGLAYFATYAQISERAGAVPPIFSGITLPDPTDPGAVAGDR